MEPNKPLLKMEENKPQYKMEGNKSQYTLVSPVESTLSGKDDDNGSSSGSIEMKDLERPEEPKPAPPPYTMFGPHRQMLIVLIATAAGMFAPLTGGIYLPSLVLFQKIFNTNSGVINASVSVYWALFGVCALFGAAASDYGGRKTVYVTTLAVFLVANTLLAVIPPTVGGLFTLRIFQALGSSMVSSSGAGTVADVTEPAKRASRLGIFLLGPQLGPILGPLIGGQFSDESRWRWIFGFLTLTCFPVYIMILFFLPETLRCLVGNGEMYANKCWVVTPKLRQKQVVENGKYPKPPRPSVKGFVSIFFFVPNCIMGLTSALNFAGVSTMYVLFPKIWQERYGWNGAETGYAFLVPGVFIVIASFGTGRILDVIYKKYKAKNGGKAPPAEKRLDMQVFAYMFSVSGKIMFGWFVKNHFHPAAPLAASAFCAIGTGIIVNSSTSYQTECMPTSIASLVALAGLMRNVASAIGGAIVDSLLQGMGFGWLFTGLAFLDIACFSGVVFVRIRGHVYRERAKAAAAAASAAAAK